MDTSCPATYQAYLRGEIDFLPEDKLEDYQILAIEGYIDVEFNEEGAAYAAPQFIYL